MWRKHKRLPTLQQAVEIEVHTNVSRKSIRPDVDWDYINETAIPLKSVKPVDAWNVANKDTNKVMPDGVSESNMDVRKKDPA